MKGPNVKLSSFCVSGSGVAYANTPLIQTRAYFEISVVELGEFCIGVANKRSLEHATQLTDLKPSWCIQSSQLKDLKSNDVIHGVTYDLSEVSPVLSFYLNGVLIPNATLAGIRGEVYPAVSVNGNCVLQANFGHTKFMFPPPSNFDAVIFSRDML